MTCLKTRINFQCLLSLTQWFKLKCVLKCLISIYGICWLSFHWPIKNLPLLRVWVYNHMINGVGILWLVNIRCGFCVDLAPLWIWASIWESCPLSIWITVICSVSTNWLTLWFSQFQTGRHQKVAEVAMFIGNFHPVRIVILRLIICQNKDHDLKIDCVEFYWRDLKITT